MEVFFQMRFSYCGKPSGIAQKRTKKSQEINEEKILRKFELLERMTLPSLRDQEDPRLRLILLTSLRMPEDCKDHLTWLLNHYLPGRSSIIYARPMIAGRVFRGHMQGLSNGDDPVVQTQVVDGDAFGKSFVKTLREHAIENWSSVPTSGKPSVTGGTFMSFNRGLNLRLKDKTPAGLEVTTAPSVPFGLSLVARASGRYNPELINPAVLGKKLPHVSIRTKDVHCMRVANGEAAHVMSPVDEGILAQAQQEFGALQSVQGISSTPRAAQAPMPVEAEVEVAEKMRRAG